MYHFARVAFLYFQDLGQKMTLQGVSVRTERGGRESSPATGAKDDRRERRLLACDPQILVTPGLLSSSLARAPKSVRGKACQAENSLRPRRAGRRGSESNVWHGMKYTSAAKSSGKTGDSLARRCRRDEKGRAPHLNFDSRRGRYWFSNPTRIDKSCHNGGASNERLPAPRSSAGPDNAALHGRNGKYNF